jgi:periplasmic divalent cation tolerance protein
MDFKHIVVLITVPSEEIAEKITNALLVQKLAACVNIVAPIRSLYTWEDKICDDEEMLLIVKSRVELFENHLVPAVLAAHPYEVPEIIALPILMGSNNYLDWIDESTIT